MIMFKKFAVIVVQYVLIFIACLFWTVQTGCNFTTDDEDVYADPKVQISTKNVQFDNFWSKHRLQSNIRASVRFVSLDWKQLDDLD